MALLELVETDVSDTEQTELLNHHGGRVNSSWNVVVLVMFLLLTIPLMTLWLHAVPATAAISLALIEGKPKFVVKVAASDDATSLDNATFCSMVAKCADGADVDAALDKMNQGDSSSYYSEHRIKMSYMLETWCALKTVGNNAESIVDVGSSWPPFLRSVDWMKEKTTVSLYFPSTIHVCPDDHFSKSNPPTKQVECKDPESDIHVIMQDFYKWQPDERLDLAMCSEVLEHVPDPVTFLRKLRAIAGIVVMSVPYHWRDFDLKCHMSHYIDKEAVRQWAGGNELYSFIAYDATDRIVMVFRGMSSASPAEALFKKITSGTCADAGMMPITHHRACAAAAEALDIESSFDVTSNSGANNAAGCNFNGSVVVLGDSEGNVKEPVCVSKY